MTKTFSQHLTEDRRLSILLILLQSTAYSANEHLMRMGLDGIGHRVSLDTLRADLVWLEEQGALHVKEVQQIYVATLTARGQDVAEGRAVIPGIKKPQAGF